MIRRSIFIKYIHTTAKLNLSLRYKNRWAREHLEDYYVKLAHKDGFRCRSAYKLIQLNQMYRFLTPGINVLDLGGSPGSWSQVASSEIFGKNATLSLENRGKIVTVDIQDIEAIPNVTILERHNLMCEKTRVKIEQLAGQGFEVVMSDMAPSPSGIRDIDHTRIIELCQIAWSLARRVLKPGGVFICKAWQGKQLVAFKNELQPNFEKIDLIVPKATKKGSAELYLLSKKFKI